MDCDRVFDLLTRGPVPAGDPRTDDAVERHLAACHDCRRLAEALRPAVDLFHEALAHEGEALPCYQGNMPVARETATLHPATLVARRSAVEVRPPAPHESSRSDSRSRSRSGMAWMIVAGGLAVCLATSLAFIGRTGPNTAPIVDGRDLDPALGLQLVEGEQRTRLESLGLTAKCRPRFRVHGTADTLVQCCAVCHEQAASRDRVHAPLASLTAACVVCHTVALESSRL